MTSELFGGVLALARAALEAAACTPAEVPRAAPQRRGKAWAARRSVSVGGEAQCKRGVKASLRRSRGVKVSLRRSLCDGAEYPPLLASSCPGST